MYAGLGTLGIISTVCLSVPCTINSHNKFSPLYLFIRFEARFLAERNLELERGAGVGVLTESVGCRVSLSVSGECRAACV